MISPSWSRRTVGLLALLLAGVVVVTTWLRFDHAGGQSSGLLLLLGGSAAIGALVATVQVLVRRSPGRS
ncbi:MAG TPA: hypothetical protein VMW80_05880 [Candidatus Dormibacteraeota bacterium]|nr:hypothetical protein [Candidatus Dormibacteraeota bacterium]